VPEAEGRPPGRPRGKTHPRPSLARHGLGFGPPKTRTPKCGGGDVDDDEGEASRAAVHEKAGGLSGKKALRLRRVPCQVA
jgi:hypothetical protein